MTKRKLSIGAIIIFIALCITALFGAFASADEIPAPGTVTGLTVTGDENALTAQWDAVSGADGYIVSVVNSNTNETVRTKNCEDTEIKINALNGADAYSVTVAAYALSGNEKICGEASEAVCVQLTKIYPAKPSDVKVSAGEAKVKLSWSASDDASGYVIYEKDTQTGKLTRLCTTDDTSCTITTLKPNQTHILNVKAYRTANGWTTYSGSAAVKAKPTLTAPDAVKGLKCGTLGTKAYLKWNSAENATSYKILRYNSEKGAYETIAQTQSCSYTVTGLSLGDKNTFRVQAVRTVNGFSATSSRSHYSSGTQKSSKNGWFKEDGKFYYYKNGSKLSGQRKIDGNYYYLSTKNYAMCKGWAYVNGYKYYYSKTTGARYSNTWSLVKNNGSYMIKVNKTANTVTVYAKDGSNGYIIPVKAFICSTGDSTPSGTFTLAYKWRWLCMVDDSYGQWVSQITGNYLFHSVPYWGVKDNNQLDVDAYNKLGTTCSHGCVRLQAGDAKWIYDNMPSGTTIKIYSNSSNPGPFGKPSITKLSSDHTWDPTDPNMSYKCEENGCH